MVIDSETRMNEENNFTAEIQKLGRITVPYETRQFLDISEGDLVVVEIKGIKHRSEPGTQESSDESLKKLQNTFIEKAEKVVELLPKVDEAMERRSKRMVEK